MRFIKINEDYINIDHIVSIEKTNGNFNTVISLSNGKDIYTNGTAKYVVHLIEATENRGKEVSR